MLLAKTVMTSLMGSIVFNPWRSSRKSFTLLNKWGCYLAKQTNATPLALARFLTDAQEHGCEQFDGMHCMNLSDCYQPIHESIQSLKEGVNKLQVDDGLYWLGWPLGDWGLGERIRNLVKIGLYVSGINYVLFGHSLYKINRQVT